MHKVKFLGEECTIEFNKYGTSDRTHIQLWCKEGPMGTATVNMPEVFLREDEVLIKDWSENSGMLKALVEAGIVEDTGRTYPTGFVVVNICRLLVKEE